jgi:hypothetical protein
MKITGLFLLLFSSFFLTSSAQDIYKGSIIMGGDLNFTYTTSTAKTSGLHTGNYKQPNDYMLSARPKVGYFIIKNLAVGIEVQYDLHSTSDTSYPSTNTLFAGPFARYYVGISDNTMLFAEIAPGFGVTTSSKGNNSTSTSAISVGVGPGIAFFISENVSLEALLQYRYLNSSYDLAGDKITLTTSRINFGFGFQYYIRNKKVGVQL